MIHAVRQTPRKLAQRLALIEPLVYRQRHPLPPFRYRRLNSTDEPAPVQRDVDASAWEVVPPTAFWGSYRTDFVLRSRFQAPGGWAGDSPTALLLALGDAGDFSHPEALVYVDGEPYATCDRHHQEVLLPLRWLDGQEHMLALAGWAGLIERPNAKLQMGESALVQIDQTTRRFVALARVALGTAGILGENELARHLLLNALDEAFKLLYTIDPFGDSVCASVPAALAALEDSIRRSGAPLDVEVVAAGHAHIDVAWLWPLAQTRRKAARTFHTVARLMEQFPAYHFTQSQPQLYEYVRQDHPALFEAIRKRVSEGRWELLGGTWVEPDMNLSGAEALARQFLLGRQFFREHFGPNSDSPVLWLPDVFGYPASLPQLIREAGMRYFFSIKLGWNQFNRMPFDSFWWQGLDGSRVLAHFSPTPEHCNSAAATYNASATPDVIRQTWDRYKQKDEVRPGVPAVLLMSYGHGDGGGGPTREMLETIDLLDDFPSMPRTHFGRAGDFFRRLEESAGDALSSWNGELYFELHRGTYTTQSRTKRANRKSEFLLHDAEFLMCAAAMWDRWQGTSGRSHEVPQRSGVGVADGENQVSPRDLPPSSFLLPPSDLHRAWRLLCLNQFHDILPGSSIGQVYADAARDHAEVRAIGERIVAEALDAIGAASGGDLVLANPTGFRRSDPAFVPAAVDTPLRRADGQPVPMQAVDGGTLLDAGVLQPYSLLSLVKDMAPPLPIAPSPTDRLSVSLTEAGATLENDHLRAEFTPAGDLVRVYDRANRREVLAPGAVANQFQAFEDRPLAWDAWDLDIFYDDKLWLAEPAASLRVVEAGPLRATLEIRRRILHSEIVQRASLCHASPRLDFDTTVDWRERHVLLKVAFPVDVLSPIATYDIQWGNVQRPTHRNTSWDWARFEVCGHKWADLSEGDYGVSLLNDCKYGYDVHGNVMRLSLLRSPTEPDPEADQGEHRMVYSLFPHAGGWGDGTIGQGYALNDPIRVWQKDGAASPTGQATPSDWSLVQADRPNMVIETIKPAEDGSGLVVRLYDSQRQRGQCTLTCGFSLAGAWRTNLLEEDEEPLAVAGNCVTVAFRPYQIITLRLIPAKPPAGLTS